MPGPTKAELLATIAALRNELTEAVEQRRATAEILHVISRSPADVQQALDQLAASAARFCHADDATLFRVDGDTLRLIAHHGPIAARSAGFSAPVIPGSVTTRALLEGRHVHVTDVTLEADEFPVTAASARELGYRTALVMPLLRQDDRLGAIMLRRTDARPFSGEQIHLLETFADQAVIAIENVRLFTELQTSNRELTTALERQTATSDILRVISRSPTELNPVFQAIVDSAGRLLGAYTATLFRVSGDRIDLAAYTSTSPAADAALQSNFPRSLSATPSHAVCVRERTPFHTTDAQEDPRLVASAHDYARTRGYRSQLVVPMRRRDDVIGTISVARREGGGFAPEAISLLQTFADQAVIAIENARLFSELQEKNDALTTALDQQTATSEILRVISRSPTDVQPVFAAIIGNAVRLCDGQFGGVFRFDGELLHLAAHHNWVGEALDAARRAYPIRPSRQTPPGRAVVERAVSGIPDVEQDENISPQAKALARTIGARSFLSVPMMKDGTAVGAITITRSMPGAFSDGEVTLLTTFADQAVIAIENVRLFTELQTSNRELTTALDTQTATSDILGVISRSQTDVQPVFDAIVSSAVRLLRGYGGSLLRVHADDIELAAFTSTDVEGDAAVRATYPRSIHSDEPLTRAIRDRVPFSSADAQSDPRLPEAGRGFARIRGYRSLMIVPLVVRDEALGAMTLSRREAGGFTDDEITLLQTFADQAVIAIENVRLFNETKEALEHQRASADVLQVISSSMGDAAPVFEAILRRCEQLITDAAGSSVMLIGDDGLLREGHFRLSEVGRAGFRTPAEADEIEQRMRGRAPRPTAGTTTDLAIRAASTLTYPDVLNGADVPDNLRAAARLIGQGSYAAAVVPLLKDGRGLGSITVARQGLGEFSPKELALLETFANQAVVAMENARLFNELQARTADLTRSVEQLTALGEVSRAVGSTLDLETVLATIVARATDLAGADAGVIYEYDAEREIFERRATERLEAEIVQALVATPIRRGQGVTGQLEGSRAPVQRADIGTLGEQLPVRDALVRAGYRSLLAVPLLHEDRLIGGLTVFRKTSGEFSANVIELLQTFATQSALAIQNARLFGQLEVKSRELEVASQHKSEFLASMSHELRTPLNAIIGFSDVLLQGMFGETNEKQTEYLRDILASGQHLLSLINDILDLSKIEAGRMDLDVTTFDLPAAVDDALLLMRERASRRAIVMERHIGPDLGAIAADPRKVKQVLLNLLSNAVKFTPEGGRITVSAGVKNGVAHISVSDTGIGIAPEDHQAVFEEFRQVGKADRKAEGTGLGLALCRKFVELHGGRISLRSEPGKGATFTFTIPVAGGVPA